MAKLKTSNGNTEDKATEIVNSEKVEDTNASKTEQAPEKKEQSEQAPEKVEDTNASKTEQAPEKEEKKEKKSKKAHSEKVAKSGEDAPENIKYILKVFKNLEEVYIDNYGGVFDKDTDPEMVKSAVLYRNPYFKK